MVRLLHKMLKEESRRPGPSGGQVALHPNLQRSQDPMTSLLSSKALRSAGSKWPEGVTHQSPATP